MTHNEKMYWSKRFDDWCKKQRREPCFENFIAYYEKMIEPTFISSQKHNEIHHFMKLLTMWCFEDENDLDCEIILRWLTKLGYTKLENMQYSPNFNLNEFMEEKADE